MLRKIALSVAALVVAVGLAVGASLLTPARKPPAQTVDLVRATKLTCVGEGRARDAELPVDRRAERVCELVEPAPQRP